jgi:hypothetical protein
MSSRTTPNRELLFAVREQLSPACADLGFDVHGD